MIGEDDVRAAARRLVGVAHRTPVVTSRTLDERVGASVFLKPENLQRGGAFKIRGAFNKISSLPEGSDVVAYSSGNHAQAVAIAAGLRGVRAVILMPEDAPRAKVEATRGYGAEIVDVRPLHAGSRRARRGARGRARARAREAVRRPARDGRRRARPRSS